MALFKKIKPTFDVSMIIEKLEEKWVIVIVKESVNLFTMMVSCRMLPSTFTEEL